MKVERLYEIALDLKAELESEKILNLLESLTNALQNQVNSPNPDHLNQISADREKLKTALQKSRVNNYPQTWLEDLDNMGALNLFGEQLAQTIDEIFTQNAITYNDALSQLNKIKKRLNTFNSQINNLTGSLDHLGFETEQLDAGEFEVGVTIPRSAVDDELGKLGKELDKVNKILLTMSEIATGSREQFKIHSISTSDPTIYVYCTPEVAAMVGGAITWLLHTYKQVQEIRINEHNLKELVSKETLASLKRDADEKIRESIEAYIQQIEQERLASREKARNEELKIELKLNLEELARRIDKGYTFDVRGEPSDEKEQNDGEGEAKPTQAAVSINKNYAAVSKARQEMRAFKPADQPILCLPPSEDESEKPKKK